MANEGQLIALRDALSQMTGLLSLELAIKTYPQSIAKELFTEDIFNSRSFLPELLALKTDDAEVALYLVPGRPVYSVFVDDTVPLTLSLPLMQALSRSAKRITQLHLRVEVQDNSSASQSLCDLAACFPTLSTLGIELELLSPSTRPLSWSSVQVSMVASYRELLTQSTAQDILTRMGPTLNSMHGLHSLSVCLYPEPFVHEKEARRAMDVLRGLGNSFQWLELGWHVWTPDVGYRPASRGHQLLRKRWAFSRPAAP